MRPWVARSLGVVIGVLLAGCTIATLARLWPGDQNRIALIVAFTPYAGYGLVLALVLSLLLYALNHGRATVATLAAIVAATIGITAQVAWAAPLHVADPRPDDGRRLTVMAANLYEGAADPERIVDLVRAHKVDVLTVSELTTAARQRLREAGLDEALPYAHAVPKSGLQGTGLWSRHPLAGPENIATMRLKNLRADLEIDGRRIAVVGVHPVFPRSQHWGGDHARLRSFLHTIEGPAIVLGDFNATVDHVPMRRLADDGFRNAADLTGAGRTPTWPVGGWTGPLFGIDHVLLRGELSARRLLAFDVPGSDHRAVVAELSVPDRSTTPHPGRRTR